MKGENEETLVYSHFGLYACTADAHHARFGGDRVVIHRKSYHRNRQKRPAHKKGSNPSHSHVYKRRRGRTA